MSAVKAGSTTKRAWTKAEIEMASRIDSLEKAVTLLLSNKDCNCGGWKCARCDLAVLEARVLLERKGVGTRQRKVLDAKSS